MKRFLFLMLALIILSVTTVLANEVSVEIDGVGVNFEDQAPVIVDGRTLVPVRGVFERLGFDIGWVASEQAVTLPDGSNNVRIVVGAQSFTANGETRSLDAPAQIINGRTMLPIRALLEAVGCSLTWDAARNTVVISSNGITSATTIQPSPNPAAPTFMLPDPPVPRPVPTGISDTRPNCRGGISTGIFDPETGNFLYGRYNELDGTILEGHFDGPSGRVIQGKVILPDGTTYEGDFQLINNNTATVLTNGTITSPDGERHTGTFHPGGRGLAEGEIRSTDGTIMRGSFNINGILVRGEFIENGITHQVLNGQIIN